MTAQVRPLVLGLHLSSRGIGWTAFIDPFTVHHHGVYRPARRNKRASCLRKVAWILGRLRPEVVVLEAFDEETSLRSNRMAKLYLEIINLAAEAGVEVSVFRRDEVQDAFRVVEARTRDEIAEAVARHVSALAPYLPGKRSPGAGEERGSALFCAAALALTHYHFEANRFFEDLRRAS